MTDLDKLCADLRGMMEKATRGEWWFTGATIRASRPYHPKFGKPGYVNSRLMFGYDGRSEQRTADYGLIVALRNNAEILLDAITALQAERDEVMEAWQNERSGLLSIIGDRDDDLEAAQETIGRLEEALKTIQGYGCPVCSGDCGSANPPVVSCPMQDISDALSDRRGG